MGTLFGNWWQQRPPIVASDKVVPLNEFDDNDVFRSIVLNLMLRFDDALDPEKLCIALEKLLNRDGWRKLGARLRLNVGISPSNKFETCPPSSMQQNSMLSNKLTRLQ